MTTGLDSPPELALLRRDLVKSRGLKSRPDLDEHHFYFALEPWPASRGWRPGSGQPDTNARLASFGKPVDRRSLAKDFAPWDNPEKMRPPKWLTKKKVEGWTFNDRRWWNGVAVDLDEWQSRPVRPVAQHWPSPLCRECWRDGITTLAAPDSVRPCQRPWHLCELHSAQERRRRTLPRSHVPCAACGYRFDRRKGGALDEACYQDWRRARRQGTSWTRFAQVRAARERARRVLMSLECEWASGDISPAWGKYLQRAIGRDPTKGVILILDRSNRHFRSLGSPTAVSALSHNGSVHAASFVSLQT